MFAFNCAFDVSHFLRFACRFNNIRPKCLCCHHLSGTKSRVRAKSTPFTTWCCLSGLQFLADKCPYPWVIRDSPWEKIPHFLLCLCHPDNSQSHGYYRHPSYLPGYRRREDKPSLLHDHSSFFLFGSVLRSSMKQNRLNNNSLWQHFPSLSGCLKFRHQYVKIFKGNYVADLELKIWAFSACLWEERGE